MSNINTVIGKSWLIFFRKSIHFEFLDAFQQAKKRALEVRESTLQLLTPKVPNFE